MRHRTVSVRPGASNAFHSLDAALAVGYYGVPREATRAAVADAVGIAPATAGTHLRKTESRVLGALAD